MDIREDVKSKFALPVRFEEGYMFDSNNQMMAEVRAWGYLQKFKNGEDLQDELGKMFAEAFNSLVKTPSYVGQLEGLVRQLPSLEEIEDKAESIYGHDDISESQRAIGFISGASWAVKRARQSA